MEHTPAKPGILRAIIRWLFVISDTTAYLFSGLLFLIAVSYPFLLKNAHGAWRQVLTFEAFFSSASFMLMAILVITITRRSIVITLLVIILLALSLCLVSIMPIEGLTVVPLIIISLITIFLLPLLLSAIEYWRESHQR